MAELWFEIEVRLPGKAPLRKMFQGNTAENAAERVRRLYRNAVVLVPQAAAKPTLVRSYTSGSVMQNLRYKRSRNLMSTSVDSSENTSAAFTQDQARQEYLEDLYNKDGRNDKSHPMHSLYTGLYMAAQQESGS
jgi:hypothetical protein